MTVKLREVIVAQTRVTSLPPYAHQQQKEKTADRQNLGTKSPKPVAAHSTAAGLDPGRP